MYKIEFTHQGYECITDEWLSGCWSKRRKKNTNTEKQEKLDKNLN